MIDKKRISGLCFPVCLTCDLVGLRRSNHHHTTSLLCPGAAVVIASLRPAAKAVSVSLLAVVVRVLLLPYTGGVNILLRSCTEDSLQSVGYAQDNPTEEKMREGLLKAIDKAVKSLKKGVKVLQYLQPNGQRVSITSTLALPNIQRAFLRRVLQDSPEVKQVRGVVVVLWILALRCKSYWLVIPWALNCASYRFISLVGCLVIVYGYTILCSVLS